MDIQCPHCNSTLEANPEHCGLTFDCPSCSKPVRISSSELQSPATKICPFCSEEIKLTAKKCKHCGEFLNRKKSSPKKRSICDVYPELAECRFSDPPPTFKQFSYALSLGILPDKLSFESISKAIDIAKEKKTSSGNYIKEEDKEKLYEYIFNKERAKSQKEKSGCLNCLIVIISLIAVISLFSTCDSKTSPQIKPKIAAKPKLITKPKPEEAKPVKKKINKLANIDDEIFENYGRVNEAVEKLVKEAYAPLYIKMFYFAIPEKVKGYKDRWILTNSFHSEKTNGRYCERHLKVTIDFTAKGKPRLLRLKTMDVKTQN